MIESIFPFLKWRKGYTTQSLRADFMAGLTVALVLIPQSMAYAQLAGMPAYYGLYASLLPPLLAALFGSSRQLATGPVAVVSLMTAASLEPLATAGGSQYIAYAILLAFMVGAFQFLLGALRLGLVVNFLSHPVVNGFTNAAAIIIASSQLSKLFGVSVDKAAHHYETIWRVVQSAFQYTHWPTLGMGALAFGIMIVAKRISPKIPGVLLAVAVTTVLSWGMGFKHDVQVPEQSMFSVGIREMIAEYNAAIAQKVALTRERTSIFTRLDVAKAEGDNVGIINAERDVRVVNVHLADAVASAHSLRGLLRSQLLDGVAKSDGVMVFYVQGNVPAGKASDGRTWRIAVGDGVIDVSNMRLMGGGAVVGDIPSGFPALVMPQWDYKIMLHLLPFAAVISLLGFMEAISIAKAMAAKTGQRLDPNQELIGQGIANVLGAFGSSYPVSGSFSRSAVNLQAGAVTGFSSVFTSIMVAIALLFFTPLLYHLPQAVLAAVIMMAVLGLINVSGFVHAWKAKWYDGTISVLSFVSTLAFAPHLDYGIMIGVALSLGVFLFRSMRPKVEVRSLASGDSECEGLDITLQDNERIAVVRFEGPLFFANADLLEERVTAHVLSNPNVQHVLVIAHGISDMDASGEEALELVVMRVRAAGRDISFCGVNDSVMDVLRRTRLMEKIGADNLHTTLEGAIGKIKGTLTALFRV